MTANKPEARELARRTIRQLSNAERDQILEQYLSDGIAADKARIAELEAALYQCLHQASYSIGEEDALSIQLGKVRDIANEALTAYREKGENQ